MSRNGKFITGIYPGTFDPVTKGHLHLIRRASRMVDKLIVAVADSPKKEPLFTSEQRLGMLKTDIENLPEKAGDKVVLWGEKLPVEIVAQHSNTISYTLLCGVTARVSFEYI